MTGKNLLILGYGLLGAAFFRLYGSDYQIRGVRRSSRKEADPLVVQMSIQDDALRVHVEWADIVIFCPAPGRREVDAYRTTYLENMQFLLQLMTASRMIRPIILVSSTGVYPRSSDQQWQESDTVPMTSSFQAILLSTENALIESLIPYAILRAAGLYGEERGYAHRVIARGFVNQSDMSDQWVTSVHQDDLCGVIHQVILQNKLGEIYNVVDRTDMTKKHLVEWMVNAFGLRIVSDGPPALTGCNRRIGTDKLTKQLGYIFRYPTVTHFLKERYKECLG